MLNRLKALYPMRYFVLLLCIGVSLLSLFALVATGNGAVVFIASTALTIVGIRDLQQRTSSVRRNYPIMGHFRFLLESIRPELRQYFLESDTEATPFSRNQRSLAYSRAKGESDKRPFGTQLDVNANGHEWINHAMVPTASNLMSPACSTSRP